MTRILLTALAWFLCMIALPARADDPCAGPMALQVLGSGGPEPGRDRASSGYLVWIDGKSRVLVDAGGGVFLRFGEAGASLDDLDFVAISHLHADHVADLPALVKAGFFSDRTRALPVAGPSAGNKFPGIKTFLRREFGPSDGAFAYLSGALDGDSQFPLKPVIEVDVARKSPRRVLDLPDLRVTAAPVHHGPVPALGYLVESHGTKIAFSGDQNGNNPMFWTMVEHADLLVMHTAIADGSDAVAANLHATPTSIGQHAAAAGVGRVVLSHWMKRSLAAMDANVATIRGLYHGPVDVAHDLGCYAPAAH
ncbi:MAG: MBL fold metallo-hydrolase [Dokdonella sp.]|uniref:MBL fold metallo-hydrolase n=1 Tax=Dokdonella sp. TaxID=2291710 RepID=UPI0032673451